MNHINCHDSQPSLTPVNAFAQLVSEDAADSEMSFHILMLPLLLPTISKDS